MRLTLRDNGITDIRTFGWEGGLNFMKSAVCR
jgi:hypothetical protein